MEFSGTERFEILRELGQGGMGVVYEAYDRLRNMRVALKTLLKLDAAGLLRFKREFRSLSEISHPNIIQLYDLVSEGKDWFFTMEILDGQDLISYVRGQAEMPDLGSTQPDGVPDNVPVNVLVNVLDSVPRPDPMLYGATAVAPGPIDTAASTLVAPRQTAARVARVLEPEPGEVPDAADRPALASLVDLTRLEDALGQLALAIHTLHEVGLVHRDIKPSNVMVTREGRVVLMDFGVVAATRDAHGLMRVDEAEGTPAFMAPEQARGETPSAPADWYAFGVSLYLLLTGRLPFDGTAMEIVLAKQDGDPTPPSKLVCDVPPMLEALCMRLLSRNPAERPHGSQVLAALGLPRGRTRLRRRPTVTATADGAFVGRTAESAALYDSYAAACAGQMRCAIISGPPGIGKSTLVQRFLHEVCNDQPAGQEPLVLASRCREREILAYKAFDGIVDGLGVYLQALPVPKRRALLPENAAVLARLFPVLRRVRELDVAVPIGAPVEMEQRGQAVRVLRALLAELARERPVILSIDDLQWADSDSLALLSSFLDPTVSAQILVLATLRSEQRDAGEPTETVSGTAASMQRLLAALEQHPVCRRIRLTPLDPDEQGALIRQLGLDADGDGGAGQSSSLQTQALMREAGGHPMLLAELARFAEEAPEELRAMDRLRLEDVIQRRVMLLPEPAQALMEAVAVAGEPVPLGILAAASELAQDDSERALATAKMVRMVQVVRSDIQPWLDAYHDKVREAVIERMSSEQVRAMHVRIAQAMEVWSEAPAALLARHWMAGGRGDKAITYLLRAAMAAQEQLAVERASALYQNAAELLESLPGDVDHDRYRCTTWLGLVRGMRLFDRIGEAMPWLERAQKVAAAYGWSEYLAEIHYLRGNFKFTSGDLPSCQAEHEQALVYARAIGSPRRTAEALSGLADAQYLRGRTASAVGFLTECIELCRQHELTDILAANLPMRGIMNLHKLDIPAALQDGSEGLALSTRTGNLRSMLVTISVCLGRIWGELGWEEAARPWLARAGTLAREHGMTRFEALTLLLQARLASCHGRHAEAESLCQEGVALMRKVAIKRFSLLGLGVLALVARDSAVRVEALDEGDRLLGDGGTGVVMLSFYRDAIEATLRAGEYERMEHYVRGLELYQGDQPVPWGRFVAERAHALAAFGQGRRDAELLATLERLFRVACQSGLHVASEALGVALMATHMHPH